MAEQPAVPIYVSWFVLCPDETIGIEGLNCVRCHLPLEEEQVVNWVVASRDVPIDQTPTLGLQLMHQTCPSVDVGG